MTEAREEVSVLYDAADLRSLYAACARCRRNLILISMIPLAFLVSDILDGEFGRDLVPDLIVYPVMGLLIAFLLYFVSPAVLVWRRKRNGWGKPVSVSLAQDGLVTRHPSQDSSYHWAGIKNVTMARNRIFIFTTPACAIILPRRAFHSDEQFQDWSRQAAAYWQAASGPIG